MTRKRFIKLLMSQGYDRNGANAMAEFVRAKNQPYATGYKAAKVSRELVDYTLPKLVEIMEPIAEQLKKIAKACSAAIDAFGRAYREELNKSE